MRPDLLGQLLFFTLAGLPVAILAATIAPRKGRSRWYALIAFIPLVNILCVLWLASLSEWHLVERIRALEAKLGMD